MWFPCKKGWTWRRLAGVPQPCWMQQWWQRRCCYCRGWTKWLHHVMIPIAGAAKGCQGVDAAGAARPHA